MECPVCNKKIQVSSQDSSQEFYYDCEHCYSGLVIKNGTCEILNHKEAPEPNEQSTPEFSEGEPSEMVGEMADEQEQGNADEIADEQELGLSDEMETEMASETENPQEENISSNEEELSLEDPDENLESLENLENLETEEEAEQEVSHEEVSLEVPSLSPEQQESNQEFSTEEQTEQETEEQETEEEDFQNQNTEGQVEDFSEVTNYGNKEGIAQDGVFYYNLTLSEINSQELAEEIENILQDPRLKFTDHDHDLMIQNGQIELNKISPVQAYVIVQSLIGLPLSISWTQHLLIDKD